MLTILLATCQTALDTLHAADNPLDRELVSDLEKMIERTQRELLKFAEPS